MDPTHNILDTPMDTQFTDRPSDFIILSSKIDFGINLLLMAAWIFTGLGALVDNDFILLLALIHFLLGCYQFGSTAVGAIRQQKPKFHYLIAIIFYLFLLAGVFSLISAGTFGDVSLYLFLGFIPFVGAIYYTKLSYETRKKLQSYD
jgi:hypothetical protein